MSKPDFNGLGITAELTLHERALRAAQNEITALKAENARLSAELRRRNTEVSTFSECREELSKLWPHPTQSQMADALRATYEGNTLLANGVNLPVNLSGDPIPPHHSTVGIGMDGEGRVQG